MARSYQHSCYKITPLLFNGLLAGGDELGQYVRDLFGFYCDNWIEKAIQASMDISVKGRYKVAQLCRWLGHGFPSSAAIALSPRDTPISGESCREYSFWNAAEHSAIMV